MTILLISAKWSETLFFEYKEIVKQLHHAFESITQQDKTVEFWYARDLQKLLHYEKWDNFLKVIEKAKSACLYSKNRVSDHFADISKMVMLGSGSQRKIDDIKLPRYACYLIAQNGDPTKTEIAFAQTYFAVQTRKQEIIEKRLAEIERLQAREKLSQSEKLLSSVIFNRDVDGAGFASIRSKCDKALFGGFSTQQMKHKFSIPGNRALADFLPTITIKAKDFANEITTFNTTRDNLQGEISITKEHVKNNTDVRNLLARKNIYPEKLPAAEDVKKVSRKIKSERKELGKIRD